MYGFQHNLDTVFTCTLLYTVPVENLKISYQHVLLTFKMMHIILLNQIS